MLCPGKGLDGGGRIMNSRLADMTNARWGIVAAKRRPSCASRADRSLLLRGQTLSPE
jgi:hypothetical protein